MKYTNKKFLAAALTAMLFSAAQTEIVHAETEHPEKIVESSEITQPEYSVKGIWSKSSDKDYPFSVEARFFAPHFDIHVKSDKIQYNDGEVGLRDDLGFGTPNAPEFIFRYNRLSIDYIHVSGDGHRTLDADDIFVFSDVSYEGDVDTKSKFNYLKINVTNPLYDIDENGGLDWSYGLTGIFWKGEVNGEVEGSGRVTYNGLEYGGEIHEKRSESESYAIPVPTLGIGAHYSVLPELNVYAHISGLPLGNYGHFYDFEAGLNYNVIDQLAVAAGFRRIHANVHHDDDSGNFTLNGPFIGVRYDF